MIKAFLLTILFVSAQAFALAPFEKFDFNSGYQPIGATLGNVCYEQGLLKVINTGSTCVEKVWEVSEDDKYDVFPGEEILTDEQWKAQGSVGRFGAFYTPSCVKFEKNGEKYVEMKRTTCLEYKTKWVDKGNNKGFKLISKCVKPGITDLPRTQRLDVYIAEIGQNLTSGQNMGSAMYTIPDCPASDNGDLPDKDIPDTKK